MEPAAADRDHCGIALQERVLLDGTVKGILRIRRIVALIECRRMIAQHPVSHGHFCRQGLQGIKALVSIVDGTLKLPILLFEGFLIVAKSVVIADFPEHTRIRAHSSRNADRPDERQDRDAVQHVSGYDKLFELTRRRSDIECVALTPHAYRAPSGLPI